MTGSPTLDFARTVRELGGAARRLGLEAPGFRTPPRLMGVDRTIRRRPGGVPTVAVRLAGRPWEAVLADLIDGVVAANVLAGQAAAQARHALWEAVTDASVSPNLSPPARVA